MTVAELIEKLKNIPHQNARVIFVNGSSPAYMAAEGTLTVINVRPVQWSTELFDRVEDPAALKVSDEVALVIE